MNRSVRQILRQIRMSELRRKKRIRVKNKQLLDSIKPNIMRTKEGAATICLFCGCEITNGKCDCNDI